MLHDFILLLVLFFSNFFRLLAFLIGFGFDLHAPAKANNCFVQLHCISLIMLIVLFIFIICNLNFFMVRKEITLISRNNYHYLDT